MHLGIGVSHLLGVSQSQNRLCWPQILGSLSHYCQIGKLIAGAESCISGDFENTYFEIQSSRVAMERGKQKWRELIESNKIPTLHWLNFQTSTHTRNSRQELVLSHQTLTDKSAVRSICHHAGDAGQTLTWYTQAWVKKCGNHRCKWMNEWMNEK